MPAHASTGAVVSSPFSENSAIRDFLRAPHWSKHGDAFQHGQSLGRTGALEVRLARGPLDLWRAQRLRYKVFYEEQAARPDFAQPDPAPGRRQI